MTKLTDLSTAQLKRAIDIKEQIEALQAQLDKIEAGGEMPVPFFKPAKKKRRMSRAGRAAIAAGMKARWARIKGTAKASKPAKKKDRRSSTATRAKLAAAAQARWARAE